MIFDKFDFDQVDDWWDVNGSYSVLHQINHLRVQYILKQLDREDLIGYSILDVGCGGGILSEALAKYGAQVTGIDSNQRAIEVAKAHLPFNLNVSYCCSKLEEFKDWTSFDLVIAFEILEHVDDCVEFLKKLCSFMHENSILFISTINRTINSLIKAKIIGEFILRWLPIGAHQWKKFVKPYEIKYLLDKNFLKIQNIVGLDFDIIQKRWIFTKNCNCNYFLTALKQ